MCFPLGKVQELWRPLTGKAQFKGIWEREKKNVPFPSAHHVVREENLLRSTVPSILSSAIMNNGHSRAQYLLVRRTQNTNLKA